MIEWLENYLSKANQSLLVVSHDRYFIDAISTDIYELDNCTINKYHGNFAYYLEKKAERQQQQAAWQAKARNLYKKELEWIRRMPQARGTKSRSRIEAFEQLEQQLQQKVEQESKSGENGESNRKTRYRCYANRACARKPRRKRAFILGFC